LSRPEHLSPPRSTLFPYTTLFRSLGGAGRAGPSMGRGSGGSGEGARGDRQAAQGVRGAPGAAPEADRRGISRGAPRPGKRAGGDAGASRRRGGAPGGAPAARCDGPVAGDGAAGGAAAAGLAGLGRRRRGRRRGGDRRLRRPDGRNRLSGRALRDRAAGSYFRRSSSWSMMSAKLWASRAPTIMMPLMKKVGVPVTPYFDPSWKSLSTSVLNFPESRQVLNLALSMPIPEAVSTRSVAAS